MQARVVCFGELLLRLAAPDRELLLQSPQFRVQIGGAEANVSVSLAKFGHDAAMVSTVADNALGISATAELRTLIDFTQRIRTIRQRVRRSRNNCQQNSFYS